MVTVSAMSIQYDMHILIIECGIYFLKYDLQLKHKKAAF